MVDRFWVSSVEASFDSTYWSEVSGGSPGASVPDATDTAYYDINGLGNCIIDGTSNLFGMNLSSGYSGSIFLSGSCSIQRVLILSGGYLKDGTINVYGDVCSNSGYGSFDTNYNASVNFLGTEKQSLFSNGGILPNVEVNKPTPNQVKAFGDYPIYLSGDFLLHDGTFHTNGHDIVTYGQSVPPPPPPPFYDVDFDWTSVELTPVFMVSGYGQGASLQPEANYSLDGISWNQVTPYTGDSDFEDLSCYGIGSTGTEWVFTGWVDGVRSTLYSPDGFNFSFCNADGLMRYGNSVATNGNIWVVVGYSDIEDNPSIMYSYNGMDWVTANYAGYTGYGEFITVRWNGTMFLAGGSHDWHNQLAYSYNGIDWFEGADPFLGVATGYTVLDVRWNGSLWMAVTGHYSGMGRSLNGLDWTSFVPGNLQIYAPTNISCKGSRWVAVGHTHPFYTPPRVSSIAYSDDEGANWVNLGNSLIRKGYYPQIVCDGTTFVISNSDNLLLPPDYTTFNSLLYSHDGSSWVGLGPTYCEWWNQGLGLGKLDIPAAEDSSVYEYVVPSYYNSTILVRSTDGSNWEDYNSLSQTVYDMTGIGDAYLLACNDGIYTTTDFNDLSPSFTATDFGGLNNIYWKEIIKGDGTYVVIGSQGAIAISTDASNWQLIKTTMYTGNGGLGYNLQGITYLNGIYFVCGDWNQRAYSYDASTWYVDSTTVVSRFYYGVGIFDSTIVVTGSTGAGNQKIWTTTDGSNLTLVRDTTGDALYVVISNDSTCVAAGGPNGQILISNDLTNWTQVGYDSAQYSSGKYLDGKFYLTGFTNPGHPIFPAYRGLISSSFDGVTWNSVLNSGHTSLAISKTLVLDTPSRPGDITATKVSDTRIDLSWMDTVSNAYGYSIKYSMDNTTFSTLMNGWKDTTSFDHTNLIGNTTYWYKLQATNLRNGSAYSETASATTDVSPLISDFIWTRDGTNDKLIHFFDDSFGADYATRQWDFGDGNFDTTSLNPSHYYADYTSVYSVTYSLETDMSSDSISRDVTTAGPFVEFTKTDYSDSTDIISGSLYLTRKNSQGIFNAFSESGFVRYVSPADTEWSRIQNTPINDPTSLLYYDWVTAVYEEPPDMVNRYIYLHIISEDRYFELHFTSWTEGALGGGFSYYRREIM